jgi:hypothetical protein
MALTAVTFLLCSFAIMFVFYFESGYRHQLEKTEPLTRGCRFRCMLGPCVFSGSRSLCRSKFLAMSALQSLLVSAGLVSYPG